MACAGPAEAGCASINLIVRGKNVPCSERPRVIVIERNKNIALSIAEENLIRRRDNEQRVVRCAASQGISDRTTRYEL